MARASFVFLDGTSGFKRANDTPIWRPTSDDNDRTLPRDRFVFGVTFEEAIERLYARYPKPAVDCLDSLIVQVLHRCVIVPPVPVLNLGVVIEDACDAIRRYGPVIVRSYGINYLREKIRDRELPLVVDPNQVVLYGGWKEPAVSYNPRLALTKRTRYENERIRKAAKERAAYENREADHQRRRENNEAMDARRRPVNDFCVTIINDVRQKRFASLVKKIALTADQRKALGIVVDYSPYHDSGSYGWPKALKKLYNTYQVEGNARIIQRHKLWAKVWDAYLNLEPEDLSACDWNIALDTDLGLDAFIKSSLADHAKKKSKVRSKTSAKSKGLKTDG